MFLVAFPNIVCLTAFTSKLQQDIAVARNLKEN
jgi:hypothetical protein